MTSNFRPVLRNISDIARTTNTQLRHLTRARLTLIIPGSVAFLSSRHLLRADCYQRDNALSMQNVLVWCETQLSCSNLYPIADKMWPPYLWHTRTITRAFFIIHSFVVSIYLTSEPFIRIKDSVLLSGTVVKFCARIFIRDLQDNGTFGSTIPTFKGNNIKKIQTLQQR